jgi:hypothetical protein
VDTLKELSQWSLAFLLVAAGVAYSLIALVRGQPVAGPPDWLSVAIGTAIGYYFGNRGNVNTMEGISNGVTSMLTKMASTTRAPSRATDPGAQEQTTP